jgi:mRNA-degrading endonuclease YafQ of YafQ-DinJ toxin-antitoxin module
VPEIIFSHRYLQRAKKFARLHPELLPQYEKTLQLLSLNPSHPSLRLHKLKGRLDSLYSASINISYRIMLDFIIENDTIIPVDVGKHEEVY